jgi:hypothetical protein
MRYFLGVHRFAPTLALIGDTGWVPSVYRRWVSIIRFRNRPVLMDNTRLTKTVFIHDYYLCVKNWSSGIKQIMIKLGCVHNFNDISAINMSKAKSAVKYYYGNIWSQDLQNTPKLRTYRQFKTGFTCEDYVTLNLKKSERSILSQFRCSILPLRIETGRFVGGSTRANTL